MVGDKEMDDNDNQITMELLQDLWEHKQEHETKPVLMVWDPPPGRDTMVREYEDQN